MENLNDEESATGFSDRHFAFVRDAYEKAKGNTSIESDSNAYVGNGLERVPAELKWLSNILS